MKLIKFDLANQSQTFERYDSDEEYQEIESGVRKLFNCVVNPQIKISEIKERRHFVKIDRN